MILHIDMDAFYAAVEQRDRPELAGRPVIVGGSPSGRGVVAAANYEVRKFGVHSAMPTSTAIQLCPHAVVLPVRMSHYAAISHQIREIFFRYTPLVEPLSLDEAFLDVTSSERLFGSAEQIARRIKHEIKTETGLIASVGLAPNKFLAKIASDLHKPDALVIVDPARVTDFLDPLPVGRLWGMGKVTVEGMSRLGISTIGELRRMPVEVSRRCFGAAGDRFWQLAQGIDDRRVVPDREAKSISNETTFSTDISDRELLRGWLMDLTDQVGRRLRRHHRLAKSVRIKVRFANFHTITRARTLKSATDVTDELWSWASHLFSDAIPEHRRADQRAVRLLGMGVSGLGNQGPVQQMLFESAEEQMHSKQKELDRVRDAVRDRFGAAALTRASLYKNASAHRRDSDHAK